VNSNLFWIGIAGLLSSAHAYASDARVPEVVPLWTGTENLVTIGIASNPAWVWMPTLPDTLEGSPILRLSYPVSTSPGWKIQKAIAGNHVTRVVTKPDEIIVDVVGPHAQASFAIIDPEGIEHPFSVSLELKHSSTFVIRHDRCATVDTGLIPLPSEGTPLFVGISCRERETSYAFYFVRSPEAKWTVPNVEKPAPHLSFRYDIPKDKSGYVPISLADPQDRAANYRFHWAIKHGTDSSNPAPQSALGGKFGMRYFSGSRKLDDATGLAGAMLALNQENRVSSFRSWVDARIFLEDFSRIIYPDTLTPDLREAYLEWLPNERLRLRGGKQIVSWGRADEVNPTDALAYRRFGLLTNDFSGEQKSGAWIAQAQLNSVNYGTFELDLLPYFLGDDLYYNGLLLQTPGSPEFRQPGFGARWDKQWNNLETGLSFFNGWDHQGNLGLSSALLPVQFFRREVMVGIDGVYTFGSYSLRWEAARTFILDKMSGPGERRDEYAGVLGLERKWNDGNGGIVFQGLLKSVLDLDAMTYAGTALEPLEAFSRQYHVQGKSLPRALMVKPWRSFFDETVTAEVAYSQDLDSSSYFLRPKLTYSPLDAWKIQVGYERFGGDPAGMFGIFQKNELGFIELSRFF
jgi:hypothetical protein